MYKNIDRLLITEDSKTSSRRDYNRHALPLMLDAADDMQYDIDAGDTPETAFTNAFTPTRMMHRVAKALGLSLDVKRGQWIL